MELNFKIQNDRLIAGSVLEGNSGNMGTYICKFEIFEDTTHMWVCVFKIGDTAYREVIKNKRCAIPQEVLEKSGNIQIGCYGTGDKDRLSTNWLTFSVKEGAYCKTTAPQEPTPDIWEELVMNSVPYIGESGNWYVFDKTKRAYVDSGMPSQGEKGDKGESASIKRFPYKPQIDITTEEAVRYIDVEKINDTPMNYYNYTCAKILITSSPQLDLASSELRIMLNRTSLYLSTPTGFVHSTTKKHWAGYFDLVSGLALGQNIAVNSKNWSAQALMATNHELMSQLVNIWGIRINSLVCDIPVGTNIKIWFK